MITADERAYHEKRITRAVLKARQAQLARLLEILGNPPDPSKYDRVPQKLWDEIEKDDRALFIPLLTAAALASAGRVARKIGGDFDPERAAERYAEKRSGELARDATKNTRDGLKDLLKRIGRREKAIEKGAEDDIREVAAEGLDTIFGPVRAESNGITETTAADSGGGAGIVDQAGKQGLIVEMLWITEKDGKVCNVCRPLHGQPEHVWSRVAAKGPPAHPRCRCELEYSLRQKEPV